MTGFGEGRREGWRASRVADVRFVDIDTGANIAISVDLNERKYVRK